MFVNNLECVKCDVKKSNFESIECIYLFRKYRIRSPHRERRFRTLAMRITCLNLCKGKKPSRVIEGMRGCLLLLMCIDVAHRNFMCLISFTKRHVWMAVALVVCIIIQHKINWMAGVHALLASSKLPAEQRTQTCTGPAHRTETLPRSLSNPSNHCVHCTHTLYL